MLIDVKQGVFLPINLQALMLPIVCNSEEFVKNNSWLCRVAQDLKLPIVPVIHKGLKDFIPEVKEALGNIHAIEGVNFSVVNEPLVMAKIDDKKQVIISGMEAHVNVLHSAIDLKQMGKEVFVVQNAITSRNQVDLDAALERLRTEGITLISKEMLMFDILKRTDTEEYKSISQKYFH